MFQVGDRVRKRHYLGEPENVVGTVVAVNGHWIHVKHDQGEGKGAVQCVSPRYDYLADDLEHLNALLRLADEL